MSKYYKDTNNNLYENPILANHVGLVEITKAQFDKMLLPTFTELQASKLSTITQAYTSANEAPIAYLKTSFDTSAATQGVIAQNLSIGSVPTGFYFRDINNTDVPMTFAELQGLGKEIQKRGLVNFSKLQTLKTAVGKAKTQADLDTTIW